MNFNQKVIKFVLLLPSFYLVYYVFNLLNTNPSSIFVLEEFKRLRNYYYLGYSTVFLVLGILVTLRRLAEENNKQDLVVRLLLPNLIVGLIITTFAYAIATGVYDFLKLLPI